jgi:two-component system cell cycle sensor histidine kinase/response regulator CckA
MPSTNERSRILIVDDDARMCQSLRELLAGQSTEIETAGSGREALRRLAEHAYDLVLLDLVLPDLSGQEVLAYIRGHHPEQLTIVLSGVSSIEAAVAALQSGAYDYIRKPAEPEELRKRVANALQQKRLAREKAAINWELEQSQRKYRYLVENSPDLIYTLDEQGRFTFFNDAFERLLGYKREQIIGRHYSEIVLPQDVEKSRFAFNERRTGERATGGLELRLVQDSSSAQPAPFPVEVKARGIYDREADREDKNFLGTYGVARDLRERKALENHLQLVEKMEAVGRLAGGIAHDFNNFLTAVIGNVALAKMHTRPDEEIHSRLEMIERATMRARDLTRQLVTFAQGGLPTRKAGRLAGLVQEAATFVLRGANARCKFFFPEDLWPAEFDSGQITQVVQNLVINADQAMKEGGVISIRGENVTVTEGCPLPLEPGRYVRIAVEDQGCGIPRENLSKIFDPFFTTKKNGMGFGLASSYSIIKSHGGYLTVESAVGEGTRFHFFLPAASGACPPEAVEPKDRLRHGQGRVLVLDDDRFLQDVYRSLLEKIGYSPVVVADGQRALAAYRHARQDGRPFAAVIMDLTVPGGMGGRELIKQLLAMDPKAVAIIASGYCKDPLMARYREHGFREAIEKPFSEQRLSEVLWKAVEGSGG